MRVDEKWRVDSLLFSSFSLSSAHSPLCSLKALFSGSLQLPGILNHSFLDAFARSLVGSRRHGLIEVGSC